MKLGWIESNEDSSDGREQTLEHQEENEGQECQTSDCAGVTSDCRARDEQ